MASINLSLFCQTDDDSRIWLVAYALTFFYHQIQFAKSIDCGDMLNLLRLKWTPFDETLHSSRFSHILILFAVLELISDSQIVVSTLSSITSVSELTLRSVICHPWLALTVKYSIVIRANALTSNTLRSRCAQLRVSSADRLVDKIMCSTDSFDPF